jgi:tagaturonate epimerase
MHTISRLLDSGSMPTEEQQRAAAGELKHATGIDIYPASLTPADRGLVALARQERSRHLAAVWPNRLNAPWADLAGSRQTLSTGQAAVEVGLLPRNHLAACALRQALPWTAPRLCGLKTSVGLGDRLGSATPGQLRAVQGSGCAPFLAQQSIREMTRTQRTPADVMDDATWGVFQAGWHEGFGSDADHLKTTADIDACDAVGFTMFTIDPGGHVRSDADTMDIGSLMTIFDESIDWPALEISPGDFSRQYLDKGFRLDDGTKVSFSGEALTLAAVKYAGAIAHTARMFRHLKSARTGRPFELEVSVDETATPTTEAEHYLIAAELKRLGVEWVSLAPRFIGDFEKGIDYKGDLRAFEKSFARHAAIARALGPYKLSLHSGSDKFSVYPIAARLSSGLVHLKTAGTSYLEALRVIARKNPALFRRILDFAFSRFETDRASYHISARIDTVPQSANLSDDKLETVLDSNDGRQLLHVTYGSVLTDTGPDGSYRFRQELLDTLADHEEEHYAILAGHIGKHVRPFGQGRGARDAGRGN